MKGISASWLGTLVFLFWAAQSFSQTDEHTEKAKVLQNPLAVKTSLTLLENIGFNVGPENKPGSVTTLQPIIPFQITPEWNVLTQTTLQFISLPSISPDEGHINGLGDATLYAVLSPNRTAEWLWGVGAVFQLPTHTNASLGTDKWGVGPAAVAMRTVENWVYGAIANTVWSFAGPKDASTINGLSVQYIVNYNLVQGWYLLSNGTITSNWQASSSHKWTVPVGGGIGKAFSLDKQALSLQLQGFYNVVEADNLPRWYFQLALQHMF